MVVVMFVVMMMLMSVVVMIMMAFRFLIGRFILDFLQFPDPCSGSGCFLEVEEAGIQQSGEVDIAVITVNYLRFRLEYAQNRADAGAFFRRNFGNLVQQDDVAR